MIKPGRLLRFNSGFWCVLLAAVAVGGRGAPAAGQSPTPSGACAADSLVLVSPDSTSVRVDLKVPPANRFGAEVSWAPVSPQDGTCAVVTKIVNPPGTPQDSLLAPVSVIGTYLDQLDREFQFTAVSKGIVGDPTRNRVMISWVNSYISRSGRVEGAMNLSNNGGLLRLTGTGGAEAWSQANLGLPPTLQTTDVMAFAQSPAEKGHLLVHLTGKGLWQRAGATANWTRVGSGVLNDAIGIAAVAYSPDDVNRFAVGTSGQGIFVTADGGQTFTQFTTALDPVLLPAYQVSALQWDTNPGGPLYVALRNLGVFVSTNQGVSFVRLVNFTVPSEFGNLGSEPAPPLVNQIRIDPTDHGRVYFAVKDWMLYGTTSAPTDPSATWTLLLGDVQTTLGQAVSGLCVAPDPGNGQALVVGTDSHGLWRSTDGGAHWLEGAYVDTLTSLKPRIRGVVFDPQQVGQLYAAADGYKLLRSQDGGASWVWAPLQPSNVSISGLNADLNGDGIWVPSYGGGIYTPGTPLPLTATMLPVTDPRYYGKDFGLSVIFEPGSVPLNASFVLKCQDYQGYAVWRSEGAGPERYDLKLVGVYDKTNPQTCIEGYCGDPNYIIEPDCFQERRAACFDLSDPNRVKFFDSDIYNGFVYNYTVTTFDYGNTAGVEPTALRNDQLFSPRYPGDANSPFTRATKLAPFRVDLSAAPAADGPEIFCYPNPLRQSAGFPGAEGQQVTFTNLPASSRIRIFTEDGDLVADLPTADTPQAGGNIYWSTRNPSGRQLASGIYFWKVDMPQRGSFFGKIVIIR